MILVIGGAYQGKLDFVKNRLKIENEKIYNNFHIQMKNWLDNGGNSEDFLENIFKANVDAVISDEIGCGVVPIEKNIRQWREAVGRALCVLAQNCDEVWRVQCGIGIKIK